MGLEVGPALGPLVEALPVLVPEVRVPELVPVDPEAVADEPVVEEVTSGTLAAIQLSGSLPHEDSEARDQP